MAVQFVPKNLESAIKELLEFCKDYDIEYDFEYGYIFEGEVSEEDVIFDEDTEFNIVLPHGDDYISCTLGEVLSMVSVAQNVEFIDDTKLISEKLTLVRVGSSDLERLSWYIDDVHTVIDEEIDGQEYTISLVSELSSYAIKLVIDDDYNKYSPPIYDDDIFIEIKSNKPIDNRIIDSLVQAYIFEMQSRLGLKIRLAPRPDYTPYWDEDDETEEGLHLKVNPLLSGKGISELLKLYNSSLSSQNHEILMLTYTKAIEYVSQTVIQEDLIKKTLIGLDNPMVNNPDASYILELSKIFEENRNNRRGLEAIKMTIKTCCDVQEIVSIAPPFLNLTRGFTVDSEPKERKKVIEEIANAINDTRNMFAHAKTNYVKKGKECPVNQLEEFTRCVDILTQQVIRWFARQSEDKRVI